MSLLVVVVAEECVGPAGPQACEDYTHVGSLVEDIAMGAQLVEATQAFLMLEPLAAPSGGAEGCDEELRGWLDIAAPLLTSSMGDVQAVVPMQNKIMANHAQIAAQCPTAWLFTLLLKIQSNLDRSTRGLPCARVHARGCLRDARGYWLLYAEKRMETASTDSGKRMDLLQTLKGGEQRVVHLFREAAAIRAEL